MNMGMEAKSRSIVRGALAAAALAGALLSWGPGARAGEVVAREGRATLARHNGVWIANLFGTREEMAYQHGRLARGMIRDSALPFFADRIHSTVRQTYILKNHPHLAAAANAVIDWVVARPLRDRLPAEDRAVDQAFARGAGVPGREVLDAQVVPDVGQWLTAHLFGDQRVGDLGCTTILAFDPGGEPLHARNLDYEGYGVFDREPAVLYFHPDDPREQAYASFTSLGLHTAGITGYNEAGLSLSLHLTYVDATSRHGTPILSVTERVVREARTLDQALDILRSEHYAGSWNVIVSSSRERRAASVEVSAEGAQARLLEGTRATLTNHVFTPLMRAKEYLPSYSAARSSRDRLAAVQAGFSARAGQPFSLQDAVDLISGGPVAVLNNVQSVVLAPGRGSAYVAVSDVPGGKPMDGRYVEVPLDLLQLSDEASLERELVVHASSLRPSVSARPEQSLAHARYREGARLASDDAQAAGDSMDRAIALLDQAGDPLMAGLTCLKARRLDPGRTRLERALADPAAAGLDAYHQSLAHLLLGRVGLAIGDSALAREHYARLTGPLAARFASERRYRAKDFRKLAIDYANRDLYRF
jgi:hypothetical protein